MSDRPDSTTGSARVRLTRFNPPGLSALSYRGGRFTPTLERMLEWLPVQPGSAEGAPLATLNRDVQADWTIALLHAWAVVTEVLGFYQERIINEGYLRTATEYRSVLELARAIGYELRPAVAASAHLAFTVLSTKNEPAREVFVPAGVAVQSVPPQGRLAQTFETAAALTARAEWNTICPEQVQLGPLPEVRRASTGLRLAGVGLALQPGATLLLLADQPSGATELPAWLLAEVRALRPDPQRGHTALQWAILPGVGTPGDVLRDVRVYPLRPPVGLFGYSRGGVYLLDQAAAAWLPAALGMPAMTVGALARTPTGGLLAATEQGVFRSLDGGASWQNAGAGLVRRAFHALASAEGGLTYAGGAGGVVVLSTDGGTSWTAMAGEGLPPPARGGVGPLPSTVVRALAAYRQGGRDWLVAGTDDGILRSTDRGRTWAPANAGLPKVDPKTGLAPVPVRVIATAPRGDTAEIFAGTDAGVFHIAAPRNTAASLALLAVAVLLFVLLFGPLQLLGRLYGLGVSAINLLVGLVSTLLKLAADALALIGMELENQPIPPITLPANIYTWLSGMIAQIPLVGQPLSNLLPEERLIFITDLLLLALAIILIFELITRVWQVGARSKAVSLAVPVAALAVGPDGRLFAATADGMFRSNDGDERSGSMLNRIARTLVRALFGDLARSWRAVEHPALTGAQVTALTGDASGVLLAGLAGGRVLRSSDGGASWEDRGLAPLKAVLALAALDDGCLAAGAPLAEPIERGWTREALRGGQLDLDRPTPDPAVDTLVLLRQPSAQQPLPAPRLARVAAASMIDSHDPARPARISRVAVDPPAGLGDFDRLSLELLGQAPELSCHNDRPVGYAPADRLVCASAVYGMESGHLLALSGQRIRVAAPSGALLRSLDDLRSDPIDPAESLVLLAAPPAPPGTETGSGEQQWRVRTRAGRVGLISCAHGALQFEPARDGDEVVSELVELEAITHQAGRATLIFRRPLANIYDRSTLTICANIAPASHGATVKNELLGSSDAMGTNQRFLLKQPPLTYMATPAGVVSTLTITVNGVRWSPVPFLHARARNQRVYVLRQDATSGEPQIPPPPEQGGSLSTALPTFCASEVIFGDGVAGAGLPTGTWKIEATYRSGSGSLGNLPAGSLSVLQSAPRGIKAVTNPLPSGGGVDPETLTNARAQAPRRLRAMDRIVALTDYEDFARAYPGVSKVQMQQIMRGRQRLLHLTIADAEVGPDADATFVEALAGAINRQRAVVALPLYIGRCEICYFRLRARLLIEPDHSARSAEIRAAARRTLVETFGFARRQIGQSVAQSEVIAVLQAIVGVAAVEIAALFIHNPEATAGADAPESQAAHQLLSVQPARLVGTTILPAQLLLIDATTDEGITLEAQL